jgi:hypothetical protein
MITGTALTPDTSRSFAFDLLELDGKDQRPLPLVERKAKLARLLAGSTAGIVFNEHTDEDGPTVFRHACRFGFEGNRVKAVDCALPVGPVPGLDQGQEPGQPSDGESASGNVVKCSPGCGLCCEEPHGHWHSTSSDSSCDRWRPRGLRQREWTER